MKPDDPPLCTHQHLAGGGLLLQAGCLDAEALLVSQVDKLPSVIFRYVLHVLGYKADGCVKWQPRNLNQGSYGIVPSVASLTVEQGHLGLDGGRLHQRAHHHRQVLLELLPQDLAHSGPGRDHVGDLDQRDIVTTVWRESPWNRGGLPQRLQPSYLRVVILQLVEVCLGFEEQLHDCRGIRHELDTERKHWQMVKGSEKKTNNKKPLWFEHASRYSDAPSPCRQPGRWGWCTRWSCRGAAGAPSARRSRRCLWERAWTRCSTAQTSPRRCRPPRRWTSPPAPGPVWCPYGSTGEEGTRGI